VLETVRTKAEPGGSAREVFAAFLHLGLTSFGGPIAHLGYFRAEFVERRRWLDDAEFSQLLALSQFLPGPASSQLGFAIGRLRAGWLGAIAAFVAFTLPSALLLFLLAYAGAALGGRWWDGTVHGLKLVAVVVVADGLWKMAKQLTPDAVRLFIAALCASIVLSLGTANAQLIALAIGALLGSFSLGSRLPASRTTGASDSSASDGAETAEQNSFGSRRGIAFPLAGFTVMLALALLLRSDEPTLTSLAAAFTRAGSLVFGGGHVVLPLLEESLVTTGWVTSDQFLTGYGAAQAVPGPMFSISAYLGALTPWSGTPSLSTAAIGAGVALLAVFTPGFLLVAAALPAWSRISASASARRAIAGLNAAVVGLLAAALYDPVITSGITAPTDVAITVAGFALALRLKRPALWLVAWCVLASLAVTVLA